jgi:hypothetical protein
MPALGEALREIIVEAGIPVHDKGHSVSRGNFNLQCPFCGAADKGAHMGVRLRDGWWGCWRNADHRGKSPVRLLVALLNKPVWEVRQLLGLHAAPELSTFADIKARLAPRDAPSSAPEALQSVAYPKEFKATWGLEAYSARRFREYLTSPARGFAANQLERLASVFSLQYATAGDFQDRVIIPYTYRGAVTTWTGRSIHRGASLRYRDLDKDSSSMFKDVLVYNYDKAALGGRALIVVEGPFDAIKGEWSAAHLGVHFVSLSTNSITEAQALQVSELSSAFDMTFVGMDTSTTFASMDSYRMVSKLRGVVDAKPLNTAALGKDFGGASVRNIINFMQGVLSHYEQSV